MTYSSDDSFPPFDALQAALVAAEAGSFTAAASALGVTHATISRRVELVENWFRLSLFDRYARGVTVTPDGQLALAKVAHAFDQLRQARDARPVGANLPIVRLATTSSFARFWLISRLQELEGAVPDLRIEVVTSALNASLSNGEVDLAIRYGRGNWNDGEEEALFEEWLFPVATPGLLRKLGACTPKTLCSLPLLHTGDTTLWRAWSKFHGRPLTPKPSDRVMGDYAQAIEAARSGLGVVLWNSAIHSLEESDGQLTAIAEMAYPSPLNFYLLSKPALAHTPPMKVRARLHALVKQSA